MTNIRWSVYLVSMILASTFISTLSSADPPADACDIQGVVLDPELIPIGGASLGLLETNPPLQTTSALDGSFLFAAVEPGAYLLAGAKVGFEPDLQDVDCLAGQTTEVILVLSPIPPPTEAFVVIYAPQAGHIGCAVGAYSISTQDLCTNLGVTPDGRNTFQFPTNLGDVTGAVYELAWTPVTKLGQCLALTYPKPAADEPIYTTNDRLFVEGAIVSGQSPLQMEIEASDPVNDPLHVFEGDETIHFNVRAPGSTTNDILADPTHPCNANLVVEQDFTLFVALFYNGAPIPDGFTMLPA